MLYSFRKQKQYYFTSLFRFLLSCATDFRVRGHLITITKGTFSYSGRSPVLRRASCPVGVLVPGCIYASAGVIEKDADIAHKASPNRLAIKVKTKFSLHVFG